MEEVALGSYPVSDQADGAGVVLSLESRSEGALHAARGALLRLLPLGALLAELEDCEVVSSPRLAAAATGLAPAPGGGGGGVAARRQQQQQQQQRQPRQE